MAFNNAVNANTPGIVGLSSVGVWTGTAVTQHNVIVGGSATDTLSNVAPSATSGVALISQGASADPVFGTVVVAGGGTGATSFTAYSVICGGTTSTGALQNVSGVGTAGQVLLSSGAGALPVWGNPAGILSWVDVTGTSVSMAVNTVYLADNASLVTLTLPATAAQFSVIEVKGYGAGGWQIAQNAGQQIIFGSVATTAGTGGSLSSTNANDGVNLVAVVGGASTIWEVRFSVGNITYV